VLQDGGDRLTSHGPERLRIGEPSVDQPPKERPTDATGSQPRQRQRVRENAVREAIGQHVQLPAAGVRPTARPGDAGERVHQPAQLLARPADRAGPDVETALKVLGANLGNPVGHQERLLDRLGGVVLEALEVRC